MLSEPSPGVYTLALGGATQPRKPAIEAWKVADPDVVLKRITVPGEGVRRPGKDACVAERPLRRLGLVLDNARVTSGGRKMR